MEEREDALEQINQEFIKDIKYKDVEDLPEQLEKYKSIYYRVNIE